MKLSVAAIVIAHNEPEYLSATLAALNSQTVSVDKIILIDTSGAQDIGNWAATADVHKLSPNTDLPTAIAKGVELAGDVGWVWLLHDDSAPKPDALQKLISAVELSPSVAIAGPKLVDWQNERIVNQLGLTLTPFGDLFSIVSGDLDQSQHDDLDDVLAVSTAAALIRTDVYRQLSGFDKSAPPLAADFDFSIRARLAGHRVIVVPHARVAHAALSMSGRRERKWLGANPKTALRRGAIHLHLAYEPLALALLFWFFLPLLGAYRAVTKLIAKRPDRIWGELAAATWGFFTLPKRLKSRALIGKTSKMSFSKLRPLRANWQQVRTSNLAALEREQTESTLAAFARGEFETEEKSVGLGFFSSGAIWLAVALAALSYKFWPAGEAASGGGLLPLSENWIDLFARAGASFQPIGLGYFGPSDPFVWMLATLGAVTFWSPSLSLAILLFIAKPLAFAGGWKVSALFTKSIMIRNVTGLVFAFWPALTLAQQNGRIGALVAVLALPWLVITVSRAAAIGKSATSTQTWSWVAVSGLLLFLIGSSSPNLIPFLLVALGLLIVSKIRRIGYLIWIPLPLAAVFTPTIIYYLIGLFKPMALLADPGLPQATPVSPLWKLILGGENFGPQLPLVGQVSGWAMVFALLLAALALLGRQWGSALMIWLAALVTLAGAWLIQQLDFAAVGVGSTTRAIQFVNGSPTALLGALGLLIAIAAGLGLDAISKPKARTVFAAILTVVTLLPSMALFVVADSQFKYTDGRVVPSIIAAEADQGSQLKTLVINPEAKSDGKLQFGAELVSGNGVQLEDVSLSYRFALAKVRESRSGEYAQFSQLVADLASANGADLSSVLQRTGVGYVLVPDQTSAIAAQLAISLDSVSELESVGATEFGKLWRVREPNKELLNANAKPQSIWSITKGVQFAILIGFVLLAMPSTNQRRRVSGDSQIFVEAGEDA
ncbi:MAG: glycosyltransferase family 2 protein [Rhodoluna sp.]